MAQATLIIKTDANVKKETARLAETFGLSVNAIVNGFLKRFIQEQTISFSLADRMSPSLEKFLKRALREERIKGKSVLHRVQNEKELDAYLDSLV